MNCANRKRKTAYKKVKAKSLLNMNETVEEVILKSVR